MRTPVLEVPSTWKLIEPEKYAEYSILSTSCVPCVEGYRISSNDNREDVVSVFDYGAIDGSFLERLSDELCKLKDNCRNVDGVNDFIKENAAGYTITHTSAMLPIFYGTVKSNGKKIFVNIMKIKTNIGVNYSLQIFFNSKNKTYCCGTSMPRIDEKNPLDSITSYKFIEQLLDLIEQAIVK